MRVELDRNEVVDRAMNHVRCARRFLEPAHAGSAPRHVHSTLVAWIFRARGLFLAKAIKPHDFGALARLCRLFLVFGGRGGNGAGLGASHQTGWTGLVAKLIQQQGTGGTIVKRDPFTDL